MVNLIGVWSIASRSIQVVLIESNHTRVAFLPDSGCVTHPVQNYFPNSCLTKLVMGD
ncbi:MAG: hypothetical protein ACXABU_09800 [Candidatus Hodarchaeales archaeon]